MKSEGIQCLKSTCMLQGCPITVSHSLWISCLAGKSLSRYQMFNRMHFTDKNPYIKWCPKEGCETAVKLKNLEVKEKQC